MNTLKVVRATELSEALRNAFWQVFQNNTELMDPNYSEVDRLLPLYFAQNGSAAGVVEAYMYGFSQDSEVSEQAWAMANLLFIAPAKERLRKEGKFAAGDQMFGDGATTPVMGQPRKMNLFDLVVAKLTEEDIKALEAKYDWKTQVNE